MTSYESTNASEAIHDALEHVAVGRAQEDIWQGVHLQADWGDGPPQRLAPGSITEAGVMLEPGDTIELVVENGTGNTIDVNPDFDFFEVPLDQYE